MPLYRSVRKDRHGGFIRHHNEYTESPSHHKTEILRLGREEKNSITFSRHLVLDRGEDNWRYDAQRVKGQGRHRRIMPKENSLHTHADYGMEKQTTTYGAFGGVLEYDKKRRRLQRKRTVPQEYQHYRDGYNRIEKQNNKMEQSEKKTRHGASCLLYTSPSPRD